MDKFIQGSDLDKKVCTGRNACAGTHTHTHTHTHTRIWTLHHHKLTSLIKIKSNNVAIGCKEQQI